MADRATFGRLALRVGESVLWTADRDLKDGLSPAQALRASRALRRLAEGAFEESTRVATATRAAKPEPTRLQLASGLPDIVVRSRETAAAARTSPAPSSAQASRSVSSCCAPPRCCSAGAADARST